MANRPKGDGKVIIDGKERTIRLTLGAIAEIEDELGLGLAQLGEIMSTGRMKPISVIMYWMLKAGGWSELQKEDMLILDLDIKQMMPELKLAMNKFSGSDIESEEEETEDVGKAKTLSPT